MGAQCYLQHTPLGVLGVLNLPVLYLAFRKSFVFSFSFKQLRNRCFSFRLPDQQIGVNCQPETCNMATGQLCSTLDVRHQSYDFQSSLELKQKEIGHENEKELRFFNPRNFDFDNVSFDLNEGLNSADGVEDFSYKLDNILGWIKNNRRR